MKTNNTPPHPTCDNCALMNLRICRNYIARFCLRFNRYIPDYNTTCNYHA